MVWVKLISHVDFTRDTNSDEKNKFCLDLQVTRQQECTSGTQHFVGCSPLLSTKDKVLPAYQKHQQQMSEMVISHGQLLHYEFHFSCRQCTSWSLPCSDTAVMRSLNRSLGAVSSPRVASGTTSRNTWRKKAAWGR